MSVNRVTQHTTGKIQRDQLLKMPERDKVKLCIDTCRVVGLCNNIVNTLADFVSNGVEVRHTNEMQKQFWRAWASKVDLVGRCERYANLLLRAGFVVIRRNTGTIRMAPPFMKRKKDFKGIPLSYTFLNPEQVEVYGNEQIGSRVIVFNIPTTTVGGNKTVNDILQKRMAKDIVIAQASGKRQIVLDSSTTWYDSYKKDDWQTYPDPFMFAAIPDIEFHERIRQMDVATIANTINVTRLIKAGVTLPTGQVARPDKAAMERLERLFSQETGGGVANLIWGDPNLSVEEFYPPMDKILGSEKYKYILDMIYSDLGIPEILVNGKGNGSFSNQFLGLRALIEKLEYLRDKAEKWLMHEVGLIMRQFGWTEAPKIKFTHMSFRDENSLLQILQGLMDRNVVSKDFVRRTVDADSDLEDAMIIDEKEYEKEEPLLATVNPFTVQQKTPASGGSSPDNGKPAGGKNDYKKRRKQRVQS